MANWNWLSRRAEAFPGREALAAGEERLTYAELDAAAIGEAERLMGEGVRPGDTVAISIPAGRDHVVRLHALAKLGAAAMPLDPRLPEAEAGRAIAAAEAAPEPPGLHSRILTGGTTGEPRPFGITHANHYWSAVGSALNLGVEPDDRWLCCLPLFHVSGMTIVMRSVIYGTAAVVHDGFDTDRVGAELAAGRITIASLVATQLARLLEAGADLASPRVLLIGGGPLPSELLEEALGRGATVVQTYGMTETCSQVATLAPRDAARKLGSAGRPLLTASIRISDDEILVKGPTVAPGTADAEGWLHTGDLGRFDDEGFLWVTGRRSETIVTGGENVMPREVEDALLSHPAVRDAAVTGRPDPKWQEAVTAIVVLVDEASATEADLREHCAASLANFKVPKSVELVEELPRNEAGKLLRSRL